MRAVALSLWLAAAPGAGLAKEAPAPASEPAPGELPFEPEHYPQNGLGSILGANPCGKGKDGDEVKDIPFSTELVYTGMSRPIGRKRMDLVRRWVDKLGVPDQSVKFEEEAVFEDGGRSYWMPVHREVLVDLRRELKRGDRVTFYLGLAGCVGTEPLLMIEEFSPPSYEDLEEEADSYIT